MEPLFDLGEELCRWAEVSGIVDEEEECGGPAAYGVGKEDPFNFADGGYEAGHCMGQD